MRSVLLVSPRKMGKIKLNLREGHIFTTFSGGNIGGNNFMFKQKYRGDILYFSFDGLVIPKTPLPPPWWRLRFPGLDRFNFIAPNFLGT